MILYKLQIGSNYYKSWNCNEIAKHYTAYDLAPISSLISCDLPIELL